MAKAAKRKARARAPLSRERVLRAADPPVIGRIAGDRVLLDVRTLRDDELAHVATAALAALA